MGSWYAAPVAVKLWNQVNAAVKGVTFLGYVGDQSHQSARSGHNYGALAEAHNYNYGAYDGRAVLAVDIGVPNDRVGYQLVEALKKDDRVLYTIFKAVGTRPNWRGGGTWASSGHMTHVHTSFTARATNNTRTFNLGSLEGPSFTIGGLTVANLTKAEWSKAQKDTRAILARVTREEHAKTRKAIWRAASRLVDVIEAVSGKRVAGRNKFRNPVTLEKK